MEVLRTWDCSLTDEEELDFKRYIFAKVWKETADKTTDKLVMSDAVAFMRSVLEVVVTEVGQVENAQDTEIA